MVKFYSPFLAFSLCFPALAPAQQTAAPASSDPQTAPKAPALAPRPAYAPTPTIGEGRVQLDVVVTDKSGKPVSGLEALDFVLKDNNLPAKILSFRAAGTVVQKDAPLVEVILLLDTVNFNFQDVSRFRQQISEFLRKNGGHLAIPVSVVVFDDDGMKVLLQPSKDGNALAEQLDHADSKLRVIGRNSQYGALDRFSLSINWIDTVAKSQIKRPGRKLLIWTGPGWPMLDRPGLEISPKDQQHMFSEIVSLSTSLREAHMAVYSVNMGQPGLGTFLYQGFLKGVKTQEKANPSDLGLKVLAVQTGGRAISPDNDVASQIDSCIQDATAWYTISFDPPRADKPNEYHDLKVEVDKPGLTARTSTGYYNQP
jgi:VWFA-related protein